MTEDSSLYVFQKRCDPLCDQVHPGSFVKIKKFNFNDSQLNLTKSNVTSYAFK